MSSSYRRIALDMTFFYFMHLEMNLNIKSRNPCEHGRNKVICIEIKVAVVHIAYNTQSSKL